jgi:hypothetical protein
MPDPHDGPEFAGAGSRDSQVSDHQGSHSNSEPSPGDAHRGSKASESDPPKKKRKVNHGMTPCSVSAGAR